VEQDTFFVPNFKNETEKVKFFAPADRNNLLEEELINMQYLFLNDSLRIWVYSFSCDYI